MCEPTWQFSKSSLPLLQQCIDAAKKQDNTENKWYKQFGSKQTKTDNEEKEENTVTHEKLNENSDTILLSSEIPEKIEDLEASVETDSDHKMDIDDSAIDTEFISELKDIDAENFDEIKENCLRDERYYAVLANHLPFKTIKQLYEHVFDLNDFNSDFFEKFCVLFLPALLKRDARLGFDLLDKAKETEGIFEKLLIVIVNDVGISKNVLQLYVSSLNYQQKMDLLDNFVQNTTNEVFIYHLHTIHTIYKETKKTEVLQMRLQSKLVEISPLCQNDKSFGKFLLNFLQVQKQFRSNYEELKLIVDAHTSIFTEACLETLDEIKQMTLNKSLF